nr:MAG TPA: Opioid growth factor receptor-like protein [Caudoviricetes sp.]
MAGIVLLARRITLLVRLLRRLAYIQWLFPTLRLVKSIV